MRVVAGSAVSALVAGAALFAVPTAVAAAPRAAATSAAAAATYGSVTTVAGGGDGRVGTASSTRLGADLRTDVAPDGTLLVVSSGSSEVLRVNPTTDRVTVVRGTGAQSPALRIRDVAADGTGIVVAADEGVVRIAADGTRTTVSALPNTRRVDIGADRAVWAANASSVIRVTTAGVVSTPVPTDAFGGIADISATPDGATLLVLDIGGPRPGVYRLTSAGLGARIAGTNDTSGWPPIPADAPSTGVSVRAATTLTTDGKTVWLSVNGRLVAFPATGGLTRWVGTGLGTTLDRLGTGFARGGRTPGGTWEVDRHDTAGQVVGRLVGVDTDRPWSPDGVPAVGALMTDVVGAAARPGGETVLVTGRGLVREVRADGILRTRATLPTGAFGGKVTLAADGTAYVTALGGLYRVPASGAPTALIVRPDLADVEVTPLGVVVADGPGRRLLRVAADGSTSVLATLTFEPKDLALDGDDLLVAGAGVVRVSPTGTVTTVLTGGTFISVATVPAGILLDQDGNSVAPFVLLPSGAQSPVRAIDTGSAQLQASGTSVVRAGYDVVERMDDAGLAPQPAPLPVKATPGPGRILVDWPGDAPATVRAKKGSAPTDPWDGEPVNDSHVIEWIGNGPVAPGEEWYLSVFTTSYPPAGARGAVNLAAPVVLRASALVDDVPPAPLRDVSVIRSKTAAGVVWPSWTDRDVAQVVGRFAPGTTPPATPTDGEALVNGLVPDAQPGQDYALSLFTVDRAGNFARWTGIARRDNEAPAQVTDVVVSPSERQAVASFTPPTDGDYIGVWYTVVPGDAVPAAPPTTATRENPLLLGALKAGTDYTLAIWSRDDLGNTSEPVLTRFHTVDDTTSPGVVTDLTATGGDYGLSATWTNPADRDLATTQAVLVDVAAGREVTFPLGRTSTSATWSKLPGGREYEVRVTTTDLNGLVSEVATARAVTNADANGAPAPVDPASVVVTPLSPTSVRVAFPRPAIPDLRTVAYAVIPVDASPDTVKSVTAFSPGPVGGTVSGTVTLPVAFEPSQLVLFVYDLNGNRARSVVPSVAGAVPPMPVPPLPTVSAGSRNDNELSVTWSAGRTTGITGLEWVVTATSGTLTRSVVVQEPNRSASFAQLPGRRDWTVTVVGRTAAATGPEGTSSAVTVKDDTGPVSVTDLRLASRYDVQTLSWTPPTTFDLDHVVVTRYGPDDAAATVVYRGSAPSVAIPGQVGGARYTYAVDTYDTFGNSSGIPVWLSSTQSTVTLSAPTALVIEKTGYLRGVATSPAGPLPWKVVTLQAQRVGTTTWSTVDTATTSGTGAYWFGVAPVGSTRYRVGYAGDTDATGTWSAVRVVTVVPVVSVRTNYSTMAYGYPVVLSTAVRPAHRGSVVTLQRWNGKTWVAVGTRRLSSTSSATYAIRPPRGTNLFRWVLPAHTDHGLGVSATVRVTVR